MNLDDLKQQWVEQDRKLDRALKLNAVAVRELQLSRTRSSLRWLRSGVVTELVITIAAILLLGSFVSSHVRQPEFLLPALLLHLCGIAYAGGCIRQLVAIAGIEFDGPIVVVQRALENVRVVRIRMTKWTVALSFILWLPLAIVAFKGLLGVDAYLIAGAIRSHDESFFTWIVANALFGVAAFLMVLWVSRRFADRFDRSPLVRSLMDDIAGRSLTKAVRSLESIAKFEAELEADR